MRVHLPFSSLIAALVMQTAWVFPAQAQQNVPSITENAVSTLVNPSIDAFVPKTHAQVMSRQVSADGEAVVLTRYERKDGRSAGLEGEHFSSVISESGRIKGFANISLDLVDRPLPDSQRSEEIARTFLQQYAPDLLPRMEIHRIDTA